MTSPIRLIREKRRDFLAVLSTAIFLSLSINLLSSWFSIVTHNNSVTVLLWSVCFSLVGILFFRSVAFGPNEHVVRIRGAVAYKIDNDSVEKVEIIGYTFNDTFCECLIGFLSENEAFKRIFVTGSTEKSNPLIAFNPDKLDRMNIINSVLEYVVLSELDLHLNAYFVENEIDKRGIEVLGRDKLNSRILKNRVIDLITKDSKERPAFLSHDAKKEGVPGEVVYMKGENGAVFNRLSFELPPKSGIDRNDDGFIVISNPLFDLTIVPKYGGFASADIPDELMPSNFDILFQPIEVGVNLIVRVKLGAFYTNQSMEIYEWIDSFIESMQDYISTERLCRRLNPDFVAMLIKNLERKGTGKVMCLGEEKGARR